MKSLTKKVIDYYPLLFSTATMLYCISFFAGFSKFLNVIFGFVGGIIFLLNIKKLIIKNYTLEFLFIFIIVISSLLGDKAFLIENFEKILLCFLQFIVLLHYNDWTDKLETNIELIKKVFILFSSVASLISLVLYLINFHAYFSKFEVGYLGDDLIGIYINPNTGGVIAAISIVFSYFYFVKMKSKNGKIILMMNMLLQLSIILYAHSNASLILVVSFFIFQYLFNLMKRKKSQNLNCIMLETFFVADIIEIVNKLANGRLNLWIIALMIIRDHFFFGVSPVAVSSNIESYSKLYELHVPSQNNGGMHNSYFQLFTSVGVLGGICGISIIVRNLCRGIRNEVVDSKYISFCLSVLIYCFFESTLFFQPLCLPMIFWIILGYIGNYNAKDIEK